MKVIMTVILSIYTAPSDHSKSVIECSYDNGRPDDRLIVDNKDLESDVVVKWFDEVCIETP